MRLHVLHDQVFMGVDEDGSEPAPGLAQLLHDLSFVQADAVSVWVPSCGIRVRWSTRRCESGSTPARSSELSLFHLPGVSGLTDGDSVIRVRALERQAVACLTRSFSARPPETRHRFWAFGVLQLLRSHGLFGVHAGAGSTSDGLNLLIAGPSGCGKSTMTLNLVRAGGSFLSDDAVLLRPDDSGVEVLALRRPFSVCVDDMAGCPGVTPLVRISGAGRKKRADIQAAYPSRHVGRFRPHAVVFPRIVGAPTSALRPLTERDAVSRLLAQSDVALLDQQTVALHVQVLSRLVRQAPPCELLAGADVRRSSAALLTILHEIRRR